MSDQVSPTSTDQPSDAVANAEAATPFDPTDEWFVMRRLGQADGLVRSGLATPGNQSVLLQVGGEPPWITVDLPLPPKELEPVIELQAPATAFSAELITDLPAQLNEVLEPLLPGRVAWDVADEAVRLTWTPHPASAQVEAVSRARVAAEQLVALMAQPEAGERRLLERLAPTLIRRELLAAIFRAHALTWVREIGAVHVLTHAAFDQEGDESAGSQSRLLALQVDAELLSTHAGRGFYLAVHAPSDVSGARLAILGRLFCEIVRERLGIRLVSTDDFEVLGDLFPMNGSMLLKATDQANLSFETWLWRLRDLLRFADSTVELWSRGHNPFELFGEEDPGEGATLEIVAEIAPAAIEAAGESLAKPRETAERVEAPKKPKAQPKTSPPPIPKRQTGRPAPVARPTPPPPPSKPKAGISWPELDGMDIPASSSAPGRSGSRAARPRKVIEKPSLDRLSTREVVKRLGMEEAKDVDIFMSHKGYNPDKTVDIMAIALSMSKDEARDIVERSPCLIMGPVTRTRASKVKTILEGTGATIQVIPTGESEG